MKGIFERAFFTLAFSIAFVLIGVLLVFSGGIILGPLAKSIDTDTTVPGLTSSERTSNTAQNIEIANWKGSIPPSDDEFVGPFNSWLNVKTGFGAKGDGITDDTNALQAAFDAVGKGNAGTLYIPAGTYLIANTLTLNHHINVSIIGADPRTTVIKWGGAAHGTMWQNNGTAYSKFNRLTWNGAGIANVAVEQSWDGRSPHFDTGNEYADDVFIDVGFGIHGGALGHGFAETSILRDQFIRNSAAGVSLGNFNALDIWIRTCIFQDCAIGVTNGFGAGNFRLYNNIFRNSTSTDISMNNTGTFSIRSNTSINSTQFFSASGSSNPSVNTFTDNVVIDPVSTQAITIGNQGPTLFINNTVRSRASATSGPVAEFKGNHHAELVSIGNKFTIANPVLANDTKIEYNNSVVPLLSLRNLKEPLLPGVEPNFNRKIFEVPTGADAPVIQSVIDQAAQASGKRPVVHFPFGTYKITSTLLVPQGTDMQLVGDGYGETGGTSTLTWNGQGAGPIISIAGPSKATLRDLTLTGNSTTTDLLITNADQKGARIFLQEVNERNSQLGMLVNQLDNTLLFAYDTEFGGSKKAVSVVGGPLANKGVPAEGRTIIYSGAESNNYESNEVSKGANLLIQDTWYEGGMKSTYVNLSSNGIFTAAGDHINMPQSTDVPAVSINNFSGKASFLADDFFDRFSINGDGSRAKLLGLGILAENNHFFADTSSPKADARMLLNRTRNQHSNISHSGSDSIPDIGVYDKAFLNDMLLNMLNVRPIILSPLPQGVTDVRLYRVMLQYGARGIDIEAGSTIINNNPTAFAGGKRYVKLPISETVLSGLGTDPDGKIIAYNWSQVSGPTNAIIISPSMAGSKITGLSSPGVYVFRLTVTDDSGAKASSDVKVTVAGN